MVDRETLKTREVIQADEFIALMEGRSLEDLDRQKEEILREQKGMKKREAAAQDEAAEPKENAEPVDEQSAQAGLPEAISEEQKTDEPEEKLSAAQHADAEEHIATQEEALPDFGVDEHAEAAEEQPDRK